MDPILIALTGLMGAAGVILTAAGAHGKPGVGLDSAGYLLLIHACAALACIAVARQGVVLRPLASVTIIGFVLGARFVCRRCLGPRLSRPPAVSVRGADRRHDPDRQLARSDRVGAFGAARPLAPFARR